MLRLKIELVPFGIEKNAIEIANAIIYNNGTGDHKIGKYNFKINCGEVSNMPPIEYKGDDVIHARSDNVLKLLYLVLKRIFGKIGE